MCVCVCEIHKYSLSKCNVHYMLKDLTTTITQSTEGGDICQ